MEENKTSMSRREEKRLARRNEILDAAMAIIVADGVEALTVSRLAKDMNAALGAVYRYFPGKQELLAALQHTALEQFDEDFQKELQHTHLFLQDIGRVVRKDAPAGMLHIIAASHSFLEDAIRAPARHSLMNILLSTLDPFMTDEGAQEVAETIQRVLSSVERLIHTATTSGSFQRGNAWQRTYMLWALIHGLDHFRKRDRLQPEHLKVTKLFHASLQTLFKGWGSTSANITESFKLFEQFLECRKATN